VYLGHVIGGGELKIVSTKIKVILKCPTPTNVTKVRSFVETIHYLKKFIASFPCVEIQLHVVTIDGSSF
jgi:hypothetical protein